MSESEATFPAERTPRPMGLSPGSTAYISAGENPISANIRYALSAVRRYAWMGLAILAAVLGLALVWTLLQTPHYTAAATIQINDQREEVLGEDFETASSGPVDWDIDRFLNTQLDILESKALAARVVNDLDLAESPEFYDAMQVPIVANGGAGEPSRDLAAELLQSRLSVDLPRSTRIATIGFESTNPRMSAQIANSFAEQFIQANLQRRFDSSSYARDFVAEQLAEARAALEQSERDLNDYAKAAGIISTRNALAADSRQNTVGTVTTASLLQLNEAAIEARSARIAAQSRWEAIRAVPLLSSQPVLENPTVQQLMTERAQLETQLQTARERYLSGHPSVQRLQAELSATENQLNSAARSVREGIRAEYAAAAASERQLDQQVGRLRGETLSEQDQSVRYNTLAREVDTARSIYDGLLQRYRELNASAGIAASNVSIIDRADPPASPSSPNLVRNLLLGLLLGLALSGLAILLRDQLDDVIHVPEDVEDKLEMPLLGVVPRSQDDPLDALDDPKSPLAEAYNSLRGALLYSTTGGLPKVIVVTSAQANEGKSTASYAVAKGFARMEMKPLLIDADLRRPSIHKLGKLKVERGLTDLLTSRDAIASAAYRAEGDDFDIVPAGPLPPSPSELLSSPRMAQLLEEAAGEYDVVIVDSPPVLGLADAPMLAAIADGTIFVVEAERGRSGQLKTALRRLRSMHPNLLGAVLVKFDPAKAGNRYSAYYGYDYYHYSGDGRSTA